MAIRCLVMSGGGAKGAFEVGAVDTLVHDGGLDFQVIAGVSAGALNALVLSQGRGPDGLREQVEELKRLWFGIRSAGDIYRNRFLGKILAFVAKDSIYDPGPLRDKIDQYGRIDRLRSSGKEFRIGVTCLETGRYECVDQTNLSIHEYTLASSSMPVLFPPVKIGNRSFVDGGVRNVTPLDNAFEALKQLSAKAPAEELEMIVLLASPLSVPEESGLWRSGMGIGKRALSMLVNEIYREDLSHALAINEAVRSHVVMRTRMEEQLGTAATERILAGLKFEYAPPKYRYVRIQAAVPDVEFSESLEFDPKKLRTAFDAGRAAARNLLDEFQLAALLDKDSARSQSLAA